jgi:ABC-2 type transport system permease protein
MILTIAKTEFKRMFASPMAWTILAVVQLILAVLLLVFTVNFVEVLQPRYAGLEETPGVTDQIVAPLLVWAGIIMLAVSPLLTMRLVSEERQTGSLPLLISSPVSLTEIMLGKYLGLMLFYLVMVGMIALMPLSLTLGGGLDWGKFAAGLIGLTLLLASFAAAGLYVSCLATQPLIAALGGFGLLLLVALLGVIGGYEGVGSEVIKYVSHFGHFLKFVEKGVIDSADLVYFLLFIGAFLVLSIRRLDNLRLQR